MNKKANLFILLLLFWLGCSGQDSSLFLSLGIITAFLTVLLMDKLFSYETKERFSWWRMGFYFLWLVKEIFLSALYTIRAIIWPKKYVSPSFGELKSKQKQELGKVILANSITLTPGTITIDVEDKILFHALNKESYDGLMAGVMDNKLSSGQM